MSRAEEIATKIRRLDHWDFDLCEELCRLAGMGDKWDNSDGETFEKIVFDAVEKLGVEVLR